MQHDPSRLEYQTGTHNVLLLYQHLIPVWLEVVALSLDEASDFPLLARVIYDWDVFSDHSLAGLLNSSWALIFCRIAVSLYS